MLISIPCFDNEKCKNFSRNSLDVSKKLPILNFIYPGPFSKADTFWARIEHFIFFLYPLANPHTTDLFWCRLHQLGLLAEKQWLRVDRLEGKPKKLFAHCVPIRCPNLQPSRVKNWSLQKFFLRYQS